MSDQFDSSIIEPQSLESISISSDKQIDPWIGKMVCNNYNILNRINQGSFGVVYKGVHQIKKLQYAIKIQDLQKKKSKLGDSVDQTMITEAQVLLSLNGEKGFPKLQFYAQDQISKNYDELFLQCQSSLSLKTVLLFLDQALNRLEFLHKNGFIHRDIKPENFLIGLGADEKILYLIDFGLALKYVNENGKHIVQKCGQPLIGTARFAPICSHQGLTQSRQSDLESLGYLAVYFLKGKLPWMQLEGKTRKEKFHNIGQKKMLIPTQSLCQGLPKEFISYFDYVFNLSFESEPSYTYIRKLFRVLFIRSQFENDNNFDWSTVQSNRFKNIHSLKNIQENLLGVSNDQRVDILEGENQKSSKRIDDPKDLKDLWKSSSMQENVEKLNFQDQDQEQNLSIQMNIKMLDQRKLISQDKNHNDTQISSSQIMIRQLQKNSFLSRYRENETEENLQFEDGNEYFPYPTIRAQLKLLDNRNNFSNIIKDTYRLQQL